MSGKTPMQSLTMALSAMLSEIPSPSTVEWVALENAAERILADDVVSPMCVPTINNAAMDGYALRFSDIGCHSEHPIVGQSFAGHPFVGSADVGACIRVTTGALVPDEFDTVVMQEDVIILNQDINPAISLQIMPKAGQHVRLLGSEIDDGQRVLTRGTKLGPLHLGLLATLGIAKVAVYPTLKVGVLSSGDELKQPGETLVLGELYDSNRIVIKSILTRLGYQVIDYGWVADDPVQLKNLFDNAAREVDALITSGGVSVGAADHTRSVLESIGQMHFWQVAIKPGKPFAFGRLKECLFFGLPGNPVSAVMTLEQLVVAGLAKRAGQSPHDVMLGQGKIMPAVAKKSLSKKTGRLDFQRVAVEFTVDGCHAEPIGLDSSGMLTSLLHADGWTLLEQERGNIDTGEHIQVQLKSPWLF